MAIDADLNGVIANVRNGVGHWKRMATRLARTLAEPQARSGTGRTERRAATTSGPKYRHDRTVIIDQPLWPHGIRRQAVIADQSQRRLPRELHRNHQQFRSASVGYIPFFTVQAELAAVTGYRTAAVGTAPVLPVQQRQAAYRAIGQARQPGFLLGQHPRPG